MIQKERPAYYDVVVEMFNSGMLQKDIADILGIKKQALAFQMKKFGFSFKRNSYRLSEIEIDEAVRLYNEGISCNEIGRILDQSHHTVLYALKLRGVKIKTKRELKFYKNYTINESAFEDLNTEESAYFYGWLVTDGWVRKDNISIELQRGDIEILDNFKNYMQSSNEIFHRDRLQPSGFVSEMCSFGFSHRPVLERLTSLGLVERKSFITYCPEVFKYNRHFWRGVIEGDGHISTSSNRMQLTGSYQLTKDFMDYCSFLNPNIRITQSSKVNVFDARVSNYNDVKLILDELYRECTLKLSRKYNVYLERYVDDNDIRRAS